MTKSTKSGKGANQKVEKGKPAKAASGKRAAGGDLPKVKVCFVRRLSNNEEATHQFKA